MMAIINSVLIFILAALAEIGGGYLIWITIREGKNVFIGVLGGIILVIYGILPTFQKANFGRVYAAYGGIFIAMSLLWGWIIDKYTPDKFDIIGAIVSLIGVTIIMYYPR